MAAFPVLDRVASAQTSLKTNNVVFVHGLFADGSCWSKVIAGLQQKGINCSSVHLWAVLPAGRTASTKARTFTNFVEQVMLGARNG